MILFFYTSVKNAVFYFFSCVINILSTYLHVTNNKYYEKTIF